MNRIRFISIIFFAIFLLVNSTNGLSSPILNEVTAFEYKIYPKGSMTKSDACNVFSQGFQHEPDGTFTSVDYLQIDCDRYRRTLACYKDIQRRAGIQKANENPAENDLSTAARTKIERACGI